MGLAFSRGVNEQLVPHKALLAGAGCLQYSIPIEGSRGFFLLPDLRQVVL